MPVNHNVTAIAHSTQPNAPLKENKLHKALNDGDLAPMTTMVKAQHALATEVKPADLSRTVQTSVVKQQPSPPTSQSDLTKTASSESGESKTPPEDKRIQTKPEYLSSPLMLPLLGSDESDLSNETERSPKLDAPPASLTSKQSSWWKLFCRNTTNMNKGKSYHSAAAIPALNFFSKAESGSDDDTMTEPETDLLNNSNSDSDSSSPRPVTPNALESPVSESYDFGYLDVSPPNADLPFPSVIEDERDYDPFEVMFDHRDDVGLLYKNEPFSDFDCKDSDTSLVRRVEKLIRRKKSDDDTVALLSDAHCDGNGCFDIEELDTSAVILHDLSLLEVKRAALDDVSEVLGPAPTSNVIPCVAHEISRSILRQEPPPPPPQQHVLSDDLRRRLSIQREYQRRLRYGRRPAQRMGSYPHGELWTVEESDEDCDSFNGSAAHGLYEL